VAGRRIFVAGEILTAANVQSFLQDQAVMVFDDATARGSAIPSPTEGMITYLKSTKSVDKFNGSAFVPAGGLIAVKDVLKTDTFSSSVSAGASVAVTGLSITHTMQSPTNKLIITAYFGAAANTAGRGNVGLAIQDGSTFIGRGDAASDRARISAGGIVGPVENFIVTMPSVTFVYLPGDTVAHTYSVRAVNVRNDTQTIFVNRSEIDSDSATFSRTTSGLVIQEVAV